MQKDIEGRMIYSVLDQRAKIKRPVGWQHPLLRDLKRKLAFRGSEPGFVVLLPFLNLEFLFLLITLEGFIFI